MYLSTFISDREKVNFLIKGRYVKLDIGQEWYIHCLLTEEKLDYIYIDSPYGHMLNIKLERKFTYFIDIGKGGLLKLYDEGILNPKDVAANIDIGFIINKDIQLPFIEEEITEEQYEDLLDKHKTYFELEEEGRIYPI